MLSNTIKKLPFIRPLVKVRDQLHDLVTTWKRYLRYAPPDHLYFPTPNLDDVRVNESAIFGSTPEVMPGIDHAKTAQLQLLQEFKTYYAELPSPPYAPSSLLLRELGLFLLGRDHLILHDQTYTTQENR